jgi:integrator complex subunit 4
MHSVLQIKHTLLDGCKRHDPAWLESLQQAIHPSSPAVDRNLALELFKLLAITLSDDRIPMRPYHLARHAFIQTCDAVNDKDISVRVHAVHNIGQITAVPTHYLLQTLSKERLPGDTKTRAKKNSTQVGDSKDGWPASAYGAFVHALEDEYSSVRSTALASMLEMGIHTRAFFYKAVPFLLDMLNDETREIRLQAAKAVAECAYRAQGFTISSAQLQMLFNTLEDPDVELRRDMYCMLKHVTFPTSSSLSDFCTKMYGKLDQVTDRTERLMMFQMAASIGPHHARLLDVGQLLGYSRHYTRNPLTLDNPVTLFNFILVANAATVTGLGMGEFPTEWFQHYAHMQAQYPGCFPHIKDMNHRHLPKWQVATVRLDKKRDAFHDMAMTKVYQLTQVLDAHMTALCTVPLAHAVQLETMLDQCQQTCRVLQRFAPEQDPCTFYLVYLRVIRHLFHQDVADHQALLDDLYHLQLAYVGLTDTVPLTEVEVFVTLVWIIKFNASSFDHDYAASIHGLLQGHNSNLLSLLNRVSIVEPASRLAILSACSHPILDHA